MIKADFSNLFKIFKIKKEFSISQEELTSFNSDFKKYKDLILSRKQGFLDLTENKEVLIKLQEFKTNVAGKYTNILVLGIGGSMLGPQTIIDTFLPKFNRKINIQFLDNIDPDIISELTDNLDFSKTLILVQTKSGGTPETISQYFYFRQKIEKLGLIVKEHFVFVTDPENGYLREVSKNEGIPSFDVPENVGGRFSVLTPIGLLVAALADLNINNLINGANWTKEKFFVDENPEAFNFATSQFLLNKKGVNINVLMPYSSKLKLLSNWYTQLLSESIGKKNDLNGNEVRAGITPVPALGATDQHSQLQLFVEGPNDKLVIFIEVENFEKEVLIPKNNEAKFSFLNNKSFNDLISAELLGTKESLTENYKPNITLTIDKVDEFNLGALFMFFEISVAFLGELLEINTFDQPGVERSKILAKENLLK